MIRKPNNQTKNKKIMKKITKFFKTTFNVLSSAVILSLLILALIHTYNVVKERNQKEAEKQRIENIISSQNAF